MNTMPGGDILDEAQRIQIRREAISELQRRGRLPKGPNILNAPPSFYKQLRDEARSGWQQDVQTVKTGVGIGKRFVSGLKEKWPQTVGSTVATALPLAVNLIPGAAATPEESITVPAGQAIGRALTNMLGRTALAGTGGMAGKAGQEAYRAATASEKAPKDIWEAIERITQAGEEEALGQVTGEGLSAVASKAIAPFAKATIPGTAELSRKLGQAAKRIPEEELAKLPSNLRNMLTANTLLPWLHRDATGRLRFGRVPKYTTLLTPAQKTVSPTLDWIESAIEGSIFGGGKVKLQKAYLQPAAMRQLTQEAVNNLWDLAGTRMSRAETAKAFSDAIVDSKDAWRSVQRIAYSKVDDLSRNIPGKKEYKGLIAEYMEGKYTGETVKQGGGYRTTIVPFESVRNRAEQTLKEAGPGLGQSKGIKILAEKASKLQDAGSFVEAISRRSDLLDEARAFEREWGRAPKLLRVADELAGLADKEMEKAAKTGGNEMYAAWRAANKLTKEGYGRFQTINLTRALHFAEKNPAKVADIFFQPNAAEGVNELRKLVPDNIFNTMRATWFERQMKKASTADGMLLGNNFKASLSEQAMGKDTIAAIFPEQRLYKDIMDVADISSIMQEKGAAGGKMVMQLTQSGQVVMTLARAASGETPKSGMLATLVVTPFMMGRLLTSQGGAKLLSQGFKTPLTSPAAGGLVARIVKLSSGETPITPISDWIKRRMQKTNEPTKNEPTKVELSGFGGRGY